jgi:hypothetical protein
MIWAVAALWVEKLGSLVAKSALKRMKPFHLKFSFCKINVNHYQSDYLPYLILSFVLAPDKLLEVFKIHGISKIFRFQKDSFVVNASCSGYCLAFR